MALSFDDFYNITGTDSLSTFHPFGNVDIFFWKPLVNGCVA